MTVAATAPSRTAVRRPVLARAVAMRLAGTEYDRLLGQLRRLSAEDWQRPTDCAAWDVRAMAGHALGMVEMAASLRESMRQMRVAKRRGGLFIDQLTALQVEEHEGLSTNELLERFAVTAPKAARARARTPALVRNRTMPEEQPVDSGTRFEPWTFGYLLDVILTRDPWMHRIDICRAVGREPELTADHDGVLVADVAGEWAQRHAQPCTLTLTGPAGGTWSWGSGGPALELDAVEFCRLLAGRGDLPDIDGHDLLATPVPF
ncbi:MAG TPA: maleylpyruvate isomerase family mycothiol-dependent enzyme [Mycobacteriales bacterium]|nr:maleylpyruvate isomerase family mycothiol-dependent enzyme [Mycobacteriales bacterium]